MNEFLKSKETNLTFKEFLNIFSNKWPVFLITCIVCILVSIISTLFFITPTYTSTAKLYVIDKNSTTINSSEISVSSYLTKDYEEIIVDRTVLEEVINRLNLRTSYKSLRSNITTFNPQNTRFIEVTVTHNTPQGAKAIADCIFEVTEQKVLEVIELDRIIIFSLGNLPTRTSSPVLSINILKSFIIGIVICFLEMLLIYFKDDKINTADDVEKYLELTVLASIPYISKKAAKKN